MSKYSAKKKMEGIKDSIPLILLIVYFCYHIFISFIQKQISMTNNEVLKNIYYYRIDKILFSLPIIYYFIKNNREYKYFGTNEKLKAKNFNTYFALIFWTNFFLSLLISLLGNINEREFIIQRPLHVGVIQAIFIAPVLEEVVFRGVLMNGLKKYGIKQAIIINSIFFGLSHYNIRMMIPAFFMGIVLSYITCRYSIKYSILLHFMMNLVANIPEIMLMLKGEKFVHMYALVSTCLLIFCLIFFITGLVKRNYGEIFSVFKLNSEDRKNITEFIKNNKLCLFIIFIIEVFSIVFHYKLF